MVGIREECVDVLEKRIFNTSFPRVRIGRVVHI